MFKDYGNCVFLSAVKEIREISYPVVILKFYATINQTKQSI